MSQCGSLANSGNLLHLSYFHLDSSQPNPVLLQTGTVRTNCMDNLDRTNVAQAALAKWTLNRQLRALGVLHETDHIDNHEEMLKDFRESMLSLGTGRDAVDVKNSVDGSCQHDLHRVQWYWRFEDRLHADGRAY